MANDIFSDPNLIAQEPIWQSLLNCLWRHGSENQLKKAMINVRTGESVTYLQLHSQSLSIAAFLHEQGFGYGDIACVVLPNTWRWAVFLIGATMTGGAVSGVNSMYTSYEMERQFMDCNCKTILTNAETLEKVVKSAKHLKALEFIIIIDNDATIADNRKIFTWSNIVGQPRREFKPPPIDLDKDIVLLPYSSGTTGIPKGVMLTHRCLGTNVNIQIRQYIKLASILVPEYKFTDEVLLNVSPFAHQMGITWSILVALQTGWTSLYMDKFDAELFLQTIQNYRIRLLRGPPPLVVLLAKSPLVNRFDLSKIQMMLTGGAPVGRELCEELRTRLPNLQYYGQAYGMTELSLASHGACFEGSNPYGNTGKLLPTFEHRIVNHISGVDCAIGEMGEVWVRGPCVMLGYWKNLKATAETIDANGWLHTGDLGYLDAEGYLFICDRLKELIKVRAFQVAPAELEDILMSHLHIQDAAVIGIPDANAGELPRAFIVKGNDRLTETEVDNFMKEKVAYYKQLKGGIEFVSEIPKSPSGKILRRLLRDKMNKKNEGSKL